MTVQIPANPVKGQKYRFLALTLAGVAQKHPTEPYDGTNPYTNKAGDMVQHDNAKAIGFDWSEDEDKLISWVCVKEATATTRAVLVADCNILNNISWDFLNSQGLIEGKEFTFPNGLKVKIGSMDGGDGSKGNPTTATLGDNEWDDWIVNVGNDPAFPISTSQDYNGGSWNATTLGTDVEKFWHTSNIYSWTKRLWTGSSNRVCRGFNGARGCGGRTPSYRNTYCGFRPRLEICISAPLITDTLGDSTDLGAPNGAFDHSFHVADGGGGNFSVTATLDGTESLLSLTDQTTGDFTASITADQWAALAYGDHTLAITATDGDSRTATRTLTFKRTFAAPAITGLTTGRRILESGEIEFTDSQEPNGPAITYEVEMATDAAFTAGLLTFPGTAGECKAAYSGLVTKTEYYARAVGISGTERRPGAAIKIKAGKTGTITLAPLEPQPNSRPDHGQPYVRGIVPAGASVTVEVCNDANDASPHWEDATATALAGNGAMHVFQNQTKTAPTWAYGMRAILDAGTSTEPIKITEMGR